MKRSNLAWILYALFVTGTIITIVIVFKDIDNYFTDKFVMGYGIFTILFLLYMITVNIIGLGELREGVQRKRIQKFIIIFVVLSVLTSFIFYVFNPSDLDFYRVFSISLGLSAGFAFFDVVFYKKLNSK